jgi:DNA modification methylase
MRPPEFLLFQGDATRIPMKPKSVHCVVCSPPYFSLRDYGTAKWIGGDPDCDHRSPTMRQGRNENRPMLAGSVATNAAQLRMAAHSACGKCGATRIDRQIGLEESPSDYVAALVAAFAEVHRVLRDDGVLWINIASSYNSSPLGNKNPMSKSGLHGAQTSASYRARLIETQQTQQEGRKLVSGLKPKDLIFIPAMLALALQKWGWFLRSDVIFAKRNAMPSPVQDRPSLSHEYVFLLTKKARYFYDGAAVAEPSETPPHARKGIATPVNVGGPMGLGGWTQYDEAEQSRVWGADGTRNCRSVWTFNTGSFPGSHYAVMAPDLAERCIRAGTSQAGCCPQCGAPYRRVIERKKMVIRNGPKSGNYGIRTTDGLSGTMLEPASSRTLGWTPGCKCDAGDPVPCRVFDPFGGVATTALVAVGLGRDGIACDLSAKYLKMGQRRIERPHAPVQRAPSPNRPEPPTPLFRDDDREFSS